MRLRWLMLAIVALVLGLLFWPQKQWTAVSVDWVLVTQRDDGVSVLYLVKRKTSRFSAISEPPYDESAEEMRLAFIKNDGTTSIATFARPTMYLLHPNDSVVVPREDGIYTYDAYTGDRPPHVYRIPYVVSEQGKIEVDDLGDDSEIRQKVAEWAQLRETSEAPPRTANVLFFDRATKGLLATSVASAMRIGLRYHEGTATLFAASTDEDNPFEVVIAEIDRSRPPRP